MGAHARWRAVAALIAVAAALVGAGCASQGRRATPTVTGYPNGDLSNARHVAGPINRDTVGGLEPAWTLPIAGTSTFGSYSSTPVVVGGVVYSQDLASNVQAVSLSTGKVLWTKAYEMPDHGPNGVVVAEGRVYGATPTAAFALDEQSGRELWSVPLVQEGKAGIDMAPGYHGGLVYISTVPGDEHESGASERVGTLWALDARTGRKVWHFDTVPQDLWSAEHGNLNSGGGVWYTPAFDSHGFMYFGVANAEPAPGAPGFPWGSSRPGRDLYTSSIVKLNASTGKLQWYFQLTPHDVYDWDLQEPPMLMTIGGRPAVVTAGKAGIVVALDGLSGKPIWQRPVGKHNGHDKDSLFALRGEYARLKLPETVYPGRLGGVIAPMANDGTTIFAPVVNLSQTISRQFEVQEPGPATGEVVALEAATGHVRWKHAFPTPAYGGTTVVNKLVFATTFDGALYALDAQSGATVWSSQLSAGTNVGVAVAGDTVLAPAGLLIASGQTAEITAFRLPGSK
jgi:glucose dehydrogenase